MIGELYHSNHQYSIINVQLGQSDSNRRIQESKSCALPLGYSPLLNSLCRRDNVIALHCPHCLSGNRYLLKIFNVSNASKRFADLHESMRNMEFIPEVRIRTVILLSLFYDAHRCFAVKLLLEWTIRDLNPGPTTYEAVALTN